MFVKVERYNQDELEKEFQLYGDVVNVFKYKDKAESTFLNIETSKGNQIVVPIVKITEKEGIRLNTIYILNESGKTIEII